MGASGCGRNQQTISTLMNTEDSDILYCYTINIRILLICILLHSRLVSVFRRNSCIYTRPNLARKLIPICAFPDFIIISNRHIASNRSASVEIYSPLSFMHHIARQCRRELKLLLTGALCCKNVFYARDAHGPRLILTPGVSGVGKPGPGPHSNTPDSVF